MSTSVLPECITVDKNVGDEVLHCKDAINSYILIIGGTDTALAEICSAVGRAPHMIYNISLMF
jgi:hypothetical protein